MSFSFGKYIKTYWNMEILHQNNIGICFCSKFSSMDDVVEKVYTRDAEFVIGSFGMFFGLGGVWFI